MKTKKLLVAVMTAFTVFLTGCAGMTQAEKTTAAILAGVGLGAAIGGPVGGAWGAVIGGSLGGAAGYVLASDKFTQNLLKISQHWETDMQAKVKSAAITKIEEDGEEKKQIDGIKFVVKTEKMQIKNRLSKDAKKYLESTLRDTKKTGGSVVVICPKEATDKIILELTKVGVSVQHDKQMSREYEIVISRNA